MWREGDRPALLGLAGLATVLYLGGQLRLLLPELGRGILAPLDALVASSAPATAILLCLLGHLVGRRLLAARRESWSSPVRVSLGWTASLLTLLWFVCAAVWVVSRVDTSDTTTATATRASIVRVLSLTWNEWLRDNLLYARSDLTALWFFTVAAQLVALSTVVVVVVGRQPAWVGGLALAGAAVAAFWRGMTYDPATWLRDSLATGWHADAFLAGVAVAALSPRLRLSTQTAGRVHGALVLILLGGVLATSYAPEEVQVQLLPVVVVLTAGACACADNDPSPQRWTIRALSAPAVQRLAMAWPYVVAWSYAVVITVGRRSSGENHYLTTMVALVIIILLVQISESVERRGAALLIRGKRLRSR
jgi:hypothetical protein